MNQNTSPPTAGGAAPPIVSIASSVAAPAIIVAASALYSAGSVYLEKIYSHYGLPSNALDVSIQAMMVSGYVSVLAIFATSIVVAAIMIIAVRKLRFLQKIHIGVHDGVRDPTKLRHILIWAYIVMVAGGVGWISGRQAAGFQLLLYQYRIQDHCQSCYVYSVGRKRIVGIAIAQDSKSMIVATRTGVAMLPTGSLKAVRPLIPRQGSVWKLLLFP